MHDTINLEQLGIPTVVVCTDVFLPTVEATMDMAGYTELRLVFVPHPISRRDDGDLRRLGEQVGAQARQMLVASTPSIHSAS